MQDWFTLNSRKDCELQIPYKYEYMCISTDGAAHHRLYWRPGGDPEDTRSLARKSSPGRIGFAATMPCPTTPCLSKPTIQTIGCYDHGGAVSCVLQTRIGLKCIPFRDEFSRGRLILMRFRINWRRNWKTGRKTCYSSTSDFWQYSVYFTY